MNSKSKAIAYSKLDSDRFELNVYRGIVSTIDPAVINNILYANSVDVLILRIPVEEKGTHHLINRIGFPFIHADTLVYYDLDLLKKATVTLQKDLTFELISSDNLERLDTLVPIIFDNYTNHYFSNPVFNKQKIKDGYLEWTKSYFDVNEAGRISWIIKSGNSYVGFATCSFDKITNECEGILYGVHPDFSGNGIYSDLINFTGNYFKNLGYKTMRVSTQIQNFSVQRIWTREGFRISKAYDTYHVNSFLTHKL